MSEIDKDINVPNKNDSISRKAALDVLRELAIEKFSLSDGFGMYIKALEDVDERIRRIPALPPAAESEQRWIPCSERLPYVEYGESDRVFATCGYRDVEDTRVRWTKELYFNGRVWCYPTGEVYNQKVYAWMERPKPWEGEHDESDD